MPARRARAYERRVLLQPPPDELEVAGYHRVRGALEVRHRRFDVRDGRGKGFEVRERREVMLRGHDPPRVERTVVGHRSPRDERWRLLRSEHGLVIQKQPFERGDVSRENGAVRLGEHLLRVHPVPQPLEMLRKLGPALETIFAGNCVLRISQYRPAAVAWLQARERTGLAGLAGGEQVLRFLLVEVEIRT